MLQYRNLSTRRRRDLKQTHFCGTSELGHKCCFLTVIGNLNSTLASSHLDKSGILLQITMYFNYLFIEMIEIIIDSVELLADIKALRSSYFQSPVRVKVSQFNCITFLVDFCTIFSSSSSILQLRTRPQKVI